MDVSPCIDDDLAAAYVGGDLPVVQRTRVEQHLDACERCRRHISALTRALTQPSVADEPLDALAPLRPGDQLGRYRLREAIGSGGMGVVWLADDPDLDRRVAVKIPRSKTSANDLERVRREARALAALRDPRVVEIYDIGLSAERCFFAMRFIPGVTLGRWAADRRGQRWREIFQACLEVGEALVVAHGAGLLHRDIKPTNVMVDDVGRVFVMDFGLAQAASSLATPRTGEEPEEVGRLTDPGKIAGTAGYIAPEIYRGAPASPHTDQFSFAVMLGELVFGDRPTRKQRHSTPHRARPRGSVPRRISSVLRRALHSDPHQRYPDMNRLLAALREAARQRLLSGRGTAAALSGAIGLVGLAGWDALGEKPRPRLQAGLATLRAAAPAPASASDEAIARSKQARARGDLDTARYAAEEALELAQRAGDERGQARALLLRGQIAQRSGDFRSAQSDFETAIARAESGGDERIPVAGRVSLMRLLGAMQLQFDDALALEPFVRVGLGRLGGDAQLEFDLEHTLGLVHVSREDGAQARVHLSRAAELATELDLDVTTRLSWLLSFATAASLEGDLAQAENLFEQAYAVLQEDTPPNPQIMAITLHNLGGIRAMRGDWPGALAASQQALEFCRAVDDDDGLSKTLLAVGQLSLQMGRVEEASQLFEEATEVRKRALPADHPLQAELVFSLGKVASARGELEDAAQLYARALVAWEADAGNMDQQHASCLAALGMLAVQQDDDEAAHEWFERAEALANEIGVAGDVAMATVWSGRGELAWREHRLDSAEVSYHRAIALRGADPEVPDPRNFAELRGLARVHLARGADEQAVALLRKVRENLERSGYRGLEVADTEFLLAQAKSSGTTAPRDALAHARRARAEVVTAQGPNAPRIAQIDAWLAEHR